MEQDGTLTRISGANIVCARNAKEQDLLRRNIKFAKRWSSNEKA